MEKLYRIQESLLKPKENWTEIHTAIDRERYTTVHSYWQKDPLTIEQIQKNYTKYKNHR